MDPKRPQADEEQRAVWLRAARRGDEAAARQLHDACYPVLYAAARSFLGDESDAHDALQSTLLRIFDRPVRDIDAVRAPTAWLLTIIRNECRRMLRSDLRRQAREFDRPAPAMSDADREDDLSDALRRHVRMLPIDQREVVILRHIGQLTFDQIAEALSENRNTIAGRYRAALGRLRSAMHHEENAHVA
jgi:RNA polymerase sigma-70 factor (ECF subfamily)